MVAADHCGLIPDVYMYAFLYVYACMQCLYVMYKSLSLLHCVCFSLLKAVYKLKQMGFEEPDVLDALRVCNNNESAAVSSDV